MIKPNKYGNTSVTGNIEELNIGAEYVVTGEAKSGKYGISYDVKNIRRDRPTTPEATKAFLHEILTYSQAEVLFEAYPDIIDRVVNDKLDDIDLNKTYNIKEKTFEVIKRKIIANFKLAELVDEFQGVFSFNIIKKLYEQYPSIDKIKENIIRKPYKCLCAINGVGFKTADEILLKVYDKSQSNIQQGKPPIIPFEEDLRTSFQRMRSAAIYVLEENETSGNTYMDIKKFKDESLTLVPEAKDKLVEVLKDGSIHFDKDNLTVGKTTTFHTESKIAKKISYGVLWNLIREKNKKEEQNRDTFFQNIYEEDSRWKNIDIEKYRVLDGFTLTDQQIHTLKKVQTQNVVILNGYGGSGKSSSTKALINMLDDNHISYKLMAPTGRAAKVISNYTKRNASTIHRGLGFRPPDEWAYCQGRELQVDVVIVDEFSMTDIFICERLVEAINFQKTKLLIIGDDAQIPSVGAGNVLYDLLRSKLIPTVTLDKIFRYGAGGLATAATDTRNCKKYLDPDNNQMQIFGEDKSYIFFPLAQEKILGNVVALYKKLLGSGYKTEDLIVLSCFNVGKYGTDAINKAIQKAVNPNDDEVVVHGETEFMIGDNVIQTKNDYRAKVYSDANIPKWNQNRYEEAGVVFTEEDGYETGEEVFIPNGEIGKVCKIENNYLVVQFDDFKIKYTKDKLLHLKLAYAISTHKSQGGQFKVVIFVTPKAHTYMLNSNLLYVGESRAQEKCYHIGEVATVHRALGKKENFDRKTYLQDLLLTEFKRIKDDLDFTKQ